MGLYTYISDQDRVNWRKVADVELKELFDEALQYDKTLMIDSIVYIEKQGLFRKPKQKIRYSIYHECFSNCYPAYQARQQISASGNKAIVMAYLYGIINGNRHKKEQDA
ncbi:MAG: hypothetical protein ACM3KI_11045 [Bacillota bacterium]